MFRFVTGLTTPVIALILAAPPAQGQFKTDLFNWQGASAPCIGVGPVGGPAAKKCADLFEQAGFIRRSELGSSGLTIGSASDDSSTITAVAPGSAAQALGIVPGDVIVAVNGVRIVPRPGSEARRLLFGEYGDSARVQYVRAGSPREATITLSRTAVKDPPKLKGGVHVRREAARELARRLRSLHWRGPGLRCRA